MRPDTLSATPTAILQSRPELSGADESASIAKAGERFHDALQAQQRAADADDQAARAAQTRADNAAQQRTDADQAARVQSQVARESAWNAQAAAARARSQQSDAADKADALSASADTKKASDDSTQTAETNNTTAATNALNATATDPAAAAAAANAQAAAQTNAAASDAQSADADQSATAGVAATQTAGAASAATSDSEQSAATSDAVSNAPPGSILAAPSAANTAANGATGTGKAALLGGDNTTAGTANAQPDNAFGKALQSANTRTPDVKGADAATLNASSPLGTGGNGGNAAAAVDPTALGAQSPNLPSTAGAATDPSVMAANGAGPQHAAETAPAFAQIANQNGNPVSSQINTPFNDPRWSQAFNQNIFMMSRGNDSHAELHLNPPDLGPVQVVLNIVGSQAQATFVSHHQHVREAIEAALPQLRERLAESGVSLAQTNVSDGSANAGGARDGGQSGGRPAWANERSSAIPAVSPAAAFVSRTAPTSASRSAIDTFA